MTARDSWMPIAARSGIALAVLGLAAVAWAWIAIFVFGASLGSAFNEFGVQLLIAAGLGGAASVVGLAAPAERLARVGRGLGLVGIAWALFSLGIFLLAGFSLG